MSKRYTESDKFKDKWYRQLSPKHKCLWEYMLACCNLAGIIELDLELFSFSIGAEIKIDDFEKFEERILFIKDDLIFIKNFVLYQQCIKSLDELNPKNKVHKIIHKKHGKTAYHARHLRPLVLYNKHFHNAILFCDEVVNF